MNLISIFAVVGLGCIAVVFVTVYQTTNAGTYGQGVDPALLRVSQRVSENWLAMERKLVLLEQAIVEFDHTGNSTPPEGGALDTLREAAHEEPEAGAGDGRQQEGLPAASAGPKDPEPPGPKDPEPPGPKDPEPPVPASSDTGEEPDADVVAEDPHAPKPGEPFRSDFKCGSNAERLAEGPMECDPQSDAPCCSNLGWCGSSKAHCTCRGCVDYRRRPAAGGDRPPPEPPRSSGGAPAQAGGGRPGKTIAIIIPFRDREWHLGQFKIYWRNYVKSLKSSPVRQWEIYVVEQFDSLGFGRGYAFNVGLAAAAGLAHTSPDISASSGVNPDCAVIHDIDYLPEAGVSYADCPVPIQLSAEIDRYDRKVPYLHNAGGIVSMSLAHWHKINGLSNMYVGWGGEDDDLYHRLRLNNLLQGDCYPFCNDRDARRGKTGYSIKRPPKGAGRFQGETMHKANHTKRIQDGAAYAKNLGMLREMEKGAPRWKKDGLSSLSVRVLSHDIDSFDAATLGITYHHLRVRRGLLSFNMSDISLAIPRTLCSPGSAPPASVSDWLVAPLGNSIPYSMADLRRITAERLAAGKASGPAAAASSCATASRFLLVDRRRSLAKVFDDSNPRLLVTYLRSLDNPTDDGLIIADRREMEGIRTAFKSAGAFASPPAEFTVCQTSLTRERYKYSINDGSGCKQHGWSALTSFKAYTAKGPGLTPLAYCENQEFWTLRVVFGESCSGSWADLRWTGEHVIWVAKGSLAKGSRYCVGTREDKEKRLSFSRVLKQSSCEGLGFHHMGSFDTVASHDPEASSLLAKLQEEGGSAAWAPAAVAASTPAGAGARGSPLYVVVEEANLCFSFLCEGTFSGP